MNGSNREVNGNRSCTYKGSSPSTKKVVTIVSPKEVSKSKAYMESCSSILYNRQRHVLLAEEYKFGAG